MPYIKLEIKDCTQCPNFSEARHYTGDSFERVMVQTCKKSNKRIMYHEGCGDKQVAIPSWCEIIVTDSSVNDSKVERIKATVKLADEWAAEQVMPESDICMGALKDVRRIVNGAT